MDPGGAARLCGTLDTEGLPEGGLTGAALVGRECEEVAILLGAFFQCLGVFNGR